MAVQVRAAGLQDLDSLVPLFDGYRQFYGRESDQALARRFLQERISRKESVVFLAEYGGQATGFVQLYPMFTSMGAAPIWVLNDLFVAPDHRRKGVGQALLEAATQFSRENGAVKLRLSTTVTNHAAQSLYERLGWVKEAQYVTYELSTP